MIQCGECGRFIGYADLDSGRAVRYLDTPDSAYSSESYVTLCAAHNERPSPEREVQRKDGAA